MDKFVFVVTQWIGYRIYVDIITGGNCRQFRLLTWLSLIGPFFHPVGGGGYGKGAGCWDIVILARCKFHLLEYMIIWCTNPLFLFLIYSSVINKLFDTILVYFFVFHY